MGLPMMSCSSSWTMRPIARCVPWRLAASSASASYAVAANTELTSMDGSCILMHMRTTLNLDQELVEKARRLSGVAEKTALVHAGLQALIARESARRLAAL